MDWPGVAMTAEAGGWFVHKFSGIEAARMVFHDARGRQTADLQRERNGWFNTDGQWSDRKPKAPPKSKASAKKKAPASPKPVKTPAGDPSFDFREETIYFLLTTRFYDGDPSNNFFCRDRIQFNSVTGKPEDPHWRGDFKGLIQRLDYIRDLGFTAIWITPPVENRSGLDYHGYHAYDWTRIDPRLESPDATYQDLINEAHARGIKIIQDVVVNHSCQYGIRGKVWIDHLPIKYYVPQGSEQGQVDHGPYQGNLGNYAWPNRDDVDNPVAPEWYRERHAMDPEGKVPLVDPKTGETVPKPGYNPGRFFGIDANELDPEWYHQDGIHLRRRLGERPSAADQAPGGRLHRPRHPAPERQGLHHRLHQPLSRHGRRRVAHRYRQACRARQPAGVRQRLEGPQAGAVRVRRKPGEGVWLGRSRRWRQWALRHPALVVHPPRPRSARPQLPAATPGFPQLDFGLFSTFRDNLSRGSYDGVGRVLEMDWIYGNATEMVTFLQNHDVGPDNDFRFRFKGGQWMAAAAYNLLWTVRGIPCLYFGEEIEFRKGAPQDVIGNDDTLDTTGRAYFGDHLTDEAIKTTQNHPLYRHIKRLNQIRRAIPALQKAPMSHVAEWGGGMSFVRDHNDGESYAVVGLAIGGGQGISVGNVRNGVYRDAVTGNEVHVGDGNHVVPRERQLGRRLRARRPRQDRRRR